MRLKHIDRFDSLKLKTRPVYEPWEIGLVKKYLREGQTFIDIGAHIGYYTTFASDIVGSVGRVFAFEPEPENYELLCRNTENRTNVIHQKIAISSLNGTGKLFINPANSGDHRMIVCPDGWDSIIIPTRRLDDIVERADFIKIDVQGHERFVLSGMTRILKEIRKLKMLIEFTPYRLDEMGTPHLELIQFLKDEGFTIATPKTYDLKRVIHQYRTHCNLFCARNK